MIGLTKTGCLARLSAALGVWAAIAPSSAQAATCPPADPQAVAGTMRDMYAAISVDDGARLNATIFAPGFYAYDGGKRFSGPELVALIAGAHKAGKAYVWMVQEPDVHVACDRAWIAYVNRGSVTDASGVLPVTWLESAVLKFDGTRWRIEFFHSTRAPAAAAVAASPAKP
jgi:hypothetical protein